MPRGKILLRLKQEPPFLPVVVSGAFNRHLIRQKASSRPWWVIAAGRNQTRLTNLFLRKKPVTANRSKSPTIRRKFPTISCSRFTGGKSIRLKRTDSSLISARVIAPPFFTPTTTKKASRRLQKRNSHAQENSRSPL